VAKYTINPAIAHGIARRARSSRQHPIVLKRPSSAWPSLSWGHDRRGG
jgi:hypothetical protein